MELVLIRHAIAEERDSGKPDAERRLTREGRQRFEAELPSFCLLLKKKKIRIWTSPLARARETAELFAGVFVNVAIEPVEAIATGSFDAFVSELAKAGPDDCIIVFGHQPHLGAWSSQLCGMELPFRKGAAAAFRSDPAMSSKAELLWFLQPGPLRRMAKHL